MGLIVLVLVPFLLLAAFAPGRAVAVVKTMHRTALFPSALQNRHRSCSISETWNLAIPDAQSTAKDRIAAQSRLLKTEAGLSLFVTPSGQFWIPSRDAITLPEELAEQQRNVYGDSIRGVRAGDVVLDCGANVGVYTRLALSRGAKLVVAIDPAPTAIESLRRNFKNEIENGRVIVYPKGVWNEEAILELTTGKTLATTANSVAINRGDHGPSVQLTTIDAIVKELGLKQVDFIKMDIEGSEPQALQGGKETISKFHPRMAVSLEHRRSDPDDLFAIVHRLWPSSQEDYGPCTNMNTSIQPDVLFVNWLR